MKKFVLIGIFVAVLAAVPALAAETTLSKEGDALYHIGNGRITAVIDADQGGAIISYKDKLGGDAEMIKPNNKMGLCYDHFQSQYWPGEMFDSKYEVAGQNSDGKVSTVSLRYEVKGDWNGMVDNGLKGLLLEKTYKLSADSPAIECDIRITAPKKESKLFAYWQQHIFFPTGVYDRDADKSFRPTVRGVRVKAGKDFGYAGVENFLRDMTAGWMALLNTRSKTGLAILSNYNELNALYANNGNTTLEAMYRITFLPPGASAEYRTWVVPVVGLDNVVCATPDYIAGYNMKSDGKGTGQLAISAIRSVSSPASLSLNVGLTGTAKDSPVLPVGTVSFSELTEQVQTKELSFRGAAADPLVLKVSAEAKSAEGAVSANSFEDYWNGAYGWGENIQTDMSTPVYTGARPPQKLSLKKPNPLKFKPGFPLRVWYAEGLMDSNYRIGDMMHTICITEKDDVFDRAFVTYSETWQMKLSAFPYDYGQLLNYSMIILGGVKDEALGNIGQEMLSDYVKAGGGMLVLGGPGAYGASRLAGTPLAEMLPVSFAEDPFDLVKVQDGVLKPEAPSPMLDDLDWSGAPTVMYMHKVELKPGAKTLVEAGGRPFIVLGEIGPAKARVACILGAPLGESGQGRTAFWKWKDWPYLMQHVGWWIMKQDYHFDAAHLP